MKKFYSNFPGLILAAALVLGPAGAGCAFAQPQAQHGGYKNGQMHKGKDFDPSSHSRQDERDKAGHGEKFRKDGERHNNNSGMKGGEKRHQDQKWDKRLQPEKHQGEGKNFNEGHGRPDHGPKHN